MSNVILAVYRFIFLKKIFYKFNRLLYQMGLHGMGVLNYRNNIESGEYFFIGNDLIIKNDGVVLDVGSNVGDYCTSIRHKNALCKIYAFEPHPTTYKKLLDNTKTLNISAFNVAVGATECSLVLYDYVDNDGSEHASLHKGVIEQLHKGRTIEHAINVVTLDEFVTAHGIGQIALLKIDTEGHEFEVLLGASGLINSGKIDVIHFEFNGMNVFSRVFFKDIWDMLPGYNLYRMLPDGLVHIESYNPVFCEIFAFQNIVAKLKVRR